VNLREAAAITAPAQRRKPQPAAIRCSAASGLPNAIAGFTQADGQTGLSFPLHGIWGARDVLYRHRLALIGKVLARAPDFVSLELLSQAGHWVQFEAADAFNAALSRALSVPTRRAG
jgi:pimeloyl-ACP methyl ester carboxylesterase